MFTALQGIEYTVSSFTISNSIFVSSFYSTFRQLGQKLRFCSTLATQQSQMKLDPHWITGFVDGEGCISIDIQKSKELKTG